MQHVVDGDIIGESVVARESRIVKSLDMLHGCACCFEPARELAGLDELPVLMGASRDQLGHIFRAYNRMQKRFGCAVDGGKKQITARAAQSHTICNEFSRVWHMF